MCTLILSNRRIASSLVICSPWKWVVDNGIHLACKIWLSEMVSRDGHVKKKIQFYNQVKGYFMPAFDSYKKCFQNSKHLYIVTNINSTSYSILMSNINLHTQCHEQSINKNNNNILWTFIVVICGPFISQLLSLFC